MGMIVVRSPRGREVRISEKLFRSVYRSQGYRPLSEPVIVSASEVPVAIGGDEPVPFDIDLDERLPGDGPNQLLEQGDDETIFALAIDGSGSLSPLPPSLADLTRAELNRYAASVGVPDPESVGNKATLLNLIGAVLREVPEI